MKRRHRPKTIQMLNSMKTFLLGGINLLLLKSLNVVEFKLEKDKKFPLHDFQLLIFTTFSSDKIQISFRYDRKDQMLLMYRYHRHIFFYCCCC